MLAIHSQAESGTAMTFTMNSEMMKPTRSPLISPFPPGCLQVDVVCTEYVEQSRVPVLRLWLLQVFDVWCCKVLQRWSCQAVCHPLSIPALFPTPKNVLSWELPFKISQTSRHSKAILDHYTVFPQNSAGFYKICYVPGVVLGSQENRQDCKDLSCLQKKNYTTIARHYKSEHSNTVACA